LLIDAEIINTAFDCLLSICNYTGAANQMIFCRQTRGNGDAIEFADEENAG